MPHAFRSKLHAPPCMRDLLSEAESRRSSNLKPTHLAALRMDRALSLLQVPDKPVVGGKRAAAAPLSHRRRGPCVMAGSCVEYDCRKWVVSSSDQFPWPTQAQTPLTPYAAKQDRLAKSPAHRCGNTCRPPGAGSFSNTVRMNIGSEAPPCAGDADLTPDSCRLSDGCPASHSRGW